MWNTEMGYLSAIEVIKKTELLRDFHFGFGLSYTSFKLTSIKVEPSPVNGPCNYEVTVRTANSPHDTEPQRDRPRRDAGREKNAHLLAHRGRNPSPELPHTTRPTALNRAICGHTPPGEKAATDKVKV